MDKKILKSIIDADVSEYRALPFWSWNDELKTDELVWQIKWMKENGFGGYFMHARGGLTTEYLGDDWFDCVLACLDAGEECKMESWAYDENGWPSGFAGGKLLTDPDNHAVYLKHEITESFPNEPEKVYAIYALNGRNKPILTDKPIDNTEKYLLVYYCTDSSYVDTMRADITEKFIKHPLEAVSVGDVVDVQVISVDVPKKRIALTMKIEQTKK